MIRVVIDTNVLFSAIYKQTGIPAQVIDLVTAGVLTPCVSPAIVAEYEEVLARPVLRPYAQRGREVLDLFGRVAVSVSPLVLSPRSLLTRLERELL